MVFPLGFLLVWGLVYLGLAMLVGRVALRRGQNGAGWFVLALVTSPLVAGLLLVLLTPPRPPSAY